MIELRGSAGAFGYRFAIVAARFNEDVTAGLLRGALKALGGAAVREQDISIFHVPGAFEIPLAARHAAETGRFDAVICLGCLIKGETMHFEYISSSAIQGIQQVATMTGVPMALGVLTALTEEQALERAGLGPENKGHEAALAAVEMATLMKQIAHLRREVRT